MKSVSKQPSGNTSTSAEIPPAPNQLRAEEKNPDTDQCVDKDESLPSDVSTPSASCSTPNNCERCNATLLRVERLQDSCRKVKQRRKLLEMEIRHLKKTNKELRKVSILSIYFVSFAHRFSLAKISQRKGIIQFSP